MKIITSGQTRDTDIQYGKIGDKKSFSLNYNKSIYRFIYELNSKKDAVYNLDKWQTFEEANPTAFTGMYQFWCQKVE